MQKEKAKADPAKDTEPLFSTLAALDMTDKYKDSNTAKPSERAVREAKKWVDRNEK